MNNESMNTHKKQMNKTHPEGVQTDGRMIVVSNRGPVGFSIDQAGDLQLHRSGGGLVTAFRGLSNNVDITWIASALDDLEKEWSHGKLSLEEGGREIDLHLVPLDEEVYEGYYNVISNPLLWFLQHSLWDFVTGPTITHKTWQAWENGYVKANQLFAQAVANNVNASSGRSIVMLQDYHLYLLPRMLRKLIKRKHRTGEVILTHFIHIPWPGAEELLILPSGMRNAILDGLTAVDLLGFQTRKDGINFLQSVESHLPGAHVNYKTRRIWYRNHATVIRDFPISIDVSAIKHTADAPETREYRQQFDALAKDQQLILRIDRTDPSKNIVRGFESFGEMLELHPEHREKVKFLALLVPSRLEVDEYHDYHDDIMAAAGWVNSRYGTRDWEPIRVMQGENYHRAVAALQIYDVLLVNSIADGMNLVAKEGPVVNKKNGVLVLSERTGASQQLDSGALIISPCDIYATAEALHQALTMSAGEREIRSNRLSWLVEENDIISWFNDQIEEINKLELKS